MAGREMKGGELIVEGMQDTISGRIPGETCGMRGGKITVMGNALICWRAHVRRRDNRERQCRDTSGLSNNGGKIVIEGNTSRPGSEMAKGTIIINGIVEEMMPVFKLESPEAVDGVTYKKYSGDVVVGGKGFIR